MHRFIWVATITSFLATALLAQQADPKATASLSAAERTFIQDAAKANQDEIAMGQLAQKSSNPQVKTYGDKLVADHTKAQKELENLATAKGIAIEPYEASSSSEYSKLSAMTGAEFDHAFAAQSVQGHRKAIAMYQQALRDARDPDLRAYISSTMRELGTHLSEAQTLERSLGKG